LPKDLLSDEEVVEKLPVLFRTLRGTPVRADKDELIEKVRIGVEELVGEKRRK
jgi:hypothetical protein